jgi:hypothetical protein
VRCFEYRLPGDSVKRKVTHGIAGGKPPALDFDEVRLIFDSERS